jgi:hypothetical protein
VRLIEVEGMIAPFCGFGADAVVLNDYALVKERLSKTPLRRVAPGALSYAIAAMTRSLPSYLLRRMPHCRIVNEGGDAQRIGARGSLLGKPVRRGQTLYEGPIRIAALSTIPYYGFGFRAFPYAEERPDRMSLRVSIIGPVKFVKNFAPIWRGDFEDPEIILDWLVEAVSIEVDPATPFQIGGDPRGERNQVFAKIAEQPIRLVDFYAPPSAS